jgi:tetratricopeptide (TPR) repeat protein
LPVTGPIDPGLVHKADENLPKRDPKPSTCVGCGDFRMQMATDPRCSPADKERLYEEARKAYQQAIRLDPDYAPGYEGLANLYVVIGDYSHAIDTFQKVLKKHDREARLWYELGMCYARQKQWEPAINHLQTACNLEPESRPYANTLGFCLARAGRFDESLACFRKAVGEGMAHYNLARMLHHMKQEELCQQQLQLALQANPDFEPAQELLAQLQGRPLPGTDPGPATAEAPAAAPSPSRPVIALGFESIDDAAAEVGGKPTTGTMLLSN